MADTKISALTALTGATIATGDLFVVVDVSDTTMAASGTDKRITLAELELAFGAWTAYTPTLTQSATVAKTVNYARYCQIGKLVHVVVSLAITGAGTTNNDVVVGAPVGFNSAIANAVVGNGSISDASAFLEWPVMVYANAGNGTFYFRRTDQVPAFITNVGKDPNFALANTDGVTFVATYEAA